MKMKSNAILLTGGLLWLGSTAMPGEVQWKHLSSGRGDLPEPNGGNQQTASLVLDIDGDGRNDFVITDRVRKPSVVWFRRGAAGWKKLLIDNTRLPIEAGGASCDIDGDGDLDIVFGADASGNRVWWWENPHPHHDPAAPWVRREIKSSGGRKHHDEMFGDFDGDGKPELVFWNQGSRILCLADIPARPKEVSPWPYHQIYSWSGGSEHEGLARADMDGDGKADIIGGGRWFRHEGGTRYRPVVIDDSQRFTRSAAGQLKRGGPPEVVFVAGDRKGPLKWYECRGDPRKTGSWVGHGLLERDVVHGHSLAVADIDGDGNLDVFCAEMHTPGHGEKAASMIFIGDGKGSFTGSEVSVGIGNHESRVADLDGDGDLDILGKPYTWDTPRVDVWLNQGRKDP